MTKTEKNKLATILQEQIDYTEKIWNEGQFSHAYIIGYLTGAIKIAIEELKKNK